jgi:deoxyhypusine synthase
MIKPAGIPEGLTVTGLVDLYRRSGAFQGGRLGEAALLYRKMIEEETTICLTLSGAMTPAGMGGAVISLIERGFIDLIVSTGANLYHDIHFALGLPVHQGDFLADDRELLKAGIERIYDIFITEGLLKETDRFVQEAMADLEGSDPLSTADVHRHLGNKIIADAPHPEKSLLAAAARHHLPIYTSSPGDSSIGMNLAYLHIKGGDIIVDPNLDVLETASIVMHAERNSVIILGGGSPKNFYLQTQPFLGQISGLESRGHDYDIQVTVDPPHWGGLSGATPSEAVSWGKINPDEIRNSVVVYCDSTIALPILAAYVISEVPAREPRRLHDSVPGWMEDLNKRIG